MCLISTLPPVTADHDITVYKWFKREKIDGRWQLYSLIMGQSVEENWPVMEPYDPSKEPHFPGEYASGYIHAITSCHRPIIDITMYGTRDSSYVLYRCIIPAYTKFVFNYTRTMVATKKLVIQQEVVPYDASSLFNRIKYTILSWLNPDKDYVDVGDGDEFVRHLDYSETDEKSKAYFGTAYVDKHSHEQTFPFVRYFINPYEAFAEVGLVGHTRVKTTGSVTQKPYNTIAYVSNNQE